MDLCPATLTSDCARMWKTIVWAWIRLSPTTWKTNSDARVGFALVIPDHPYPKLCGIVRALPWLIPDYQLENRPVWALPWLFPYLSGNVELDASVGFVLAIPDHRRLRGDVAWHWLSTIASGNYCMGMAQAHPYLGFCGNVENRLGRQALAIPISQPTLYCVEMWVMKHPWRACRKLPGYLLQYIPRNTQVCEKQTGKPVWAWARLSP